MSARTSSSAVAAVDLGATSGRVILGHVSHNELSIMPVARFPNTPVRTIDGLHWNILELYRSVLAGLTVAAREEPALSSIAVDSWAVDYALMRGGRMLGVPYHYRDERTAAGVDAAHRRVDPQTLYATNGLQHLPFNTLFQLEADQIAGSLDAADGLLLVPDLINYWLTGVAAAERTNASTTGLLGVQSGEWDDDLIAALELPRAIFPKLVDAGTSLGPVLGRVADDLQLGPHTRVTAVGSHDTASAVVAVPATGDDFAFISCGTWGLVGVELPSPVLTAEGRLANFTNEGGVDGRVRYLHNVMGLWLLSESVRIWEKDGESIDLAALLAGAAALTTPVSVFDANDPVFLSPGDMPARIAQWCSEHGVGAPGSRVEFVRSIVESLAEAFASAVRRASELSGKTVSVIHIVGGGSLNSLLCQRTADRSGLPVLAGPVEATAIGNVLVQARAQGMVSGSLESLRSLVALAFAPLRYTPTADRAR
ncbi:rhamnulokinase [Glaciihabitans tibetensis]|uniref:Rhamnulokinase n=1 Tax=Glaciihabitans tibetensis TaxID=1266600 RepID=A0A2T0VCC5_9MICO|nr:rhamnulokinase family protein [Glaciihabitans tibetensis]PRY67842.1 rhamnulokinase [Glaciihabitans tibetensis]